MFWSGSDEGAVHDVPAYFSGEEWEHLHKWQKQLYRSVMKEIHHALMSLGPLIATTVFSLQSKEKEELIPKHDKDTERRHSCNQPARDEVFAVRIKCEDEPFCLEPKQCESSQILKNPHDKERLKRKSNIDYSLKCDDETTVNKSVVNELKANQVECIYEQGVPMSQEWPGRDQVPREEVAHWPNGCSQQTNTKVHQLTSEIQRSEASNVCEWIMEDDHIISAKLGKPQECGSQSYSENEQIGPTKHKKAREAKIKHTCSHCGKGFTVMSNLIKHERIHTGERPFSCLTCEKSFHQIGDLRRHEKLHTGERPYLCNICGKRFSRKHHLLVHNKKIHTKKLQSDQIDLLGNRGSTKAFYTKEKMDLEQMKDG